MISRSAIVAALRTESYRWKRGEMSTEFVLGIIRGLQIAIHIVQGIPDSRRNP